MPCVCELVEDQKIAEKISNASYQKYRHLRYQLQSGLTSARYLLEAVRFNLTVCVSLIFTYLRL